MKEELYKEDFFGSCTYQLVDLNTLDISFKTKKGFVVNKKQENAKKEHTSCKKISNASAFTCKKTL